MVNDDGRSHDPTLDLLSAAAWVARVVEADQYRVTGLTAGTDIAPVWLPCGDPRAVRQARRRVRACLSLSAAPHPDTTAVFPEQMFLADVAECATPEVAALLTQAARRPTRSDVAALAVSHGRMCVLVVARSTVTGVAPVEATDSLQRFREPLARALSDQVTDG